MHVRVKTSISWLGAALALALMAAWYYGAFKRDTSLPTVSASVATSTEVVSQAQEPRAKDLPALQPASSPATTALAARAEPARQLKAEWPKLSARSDLKDFFESILASRQLDQLLIGANVSGVCGGERSAWGSQEDRANMLFPSADQRQQLRNRVETAAKDLHALCGTADIESFANQIRAALSSLPPGSSSLAKNLIVLGGRSSDQQYPQMVTQLLLNPGAEPVAFDRWLTRDLWISSAAGRSVGSSLSLAQRAFVEDRLYSRFVPNAEPDSIRNLQRCAVSLMCEGLYGLSDTQQAKAIEFADLVEGAIRTQRWSLIFG